MKLQVAALEDLVTKLHEHDLDSNELVQKALAYVKEQYESQVVRSGLSFLEGAIYPATMLVIEHQESSKQKITPELVTGALLHGILSYNSEMDDDTFRNRFGEDIFKILQPLKKPFGLWSHQKKYSYEMFRRITNNALLKTLETAPDESKIIALAERLQQIYTMGMPFGSNEIDKAEYIKELEEFYLPFAQRFSPYFYGKMKIGIGDLSKQVLLIMFPFYKTRRIVSSALKSLS